MAEGGEKENPRHSSDAPATPARVFISYASPDAAVAGGLVEALERHGIPCWIAPRDVKAGALYADAIVRAISGARALVLVLSENAISSSHVGKEVERASSKKRPIFALRIDNAPLTPALEYFLSESQWVEAQAENKESAYARLIDAIRDPERAPPGISQASTPTAGAATEAHPTGRRSRILLAVGLAVIAVALAALLADRFWLAKHVVGAEHEITAPPPQDPHSPSVSPDAPTPAFAPPPHSIAVLPFVNMSGDAKQDYFSDGISEELLDALSRLDQLHVVARTSSFSFRGQNVDTSTIAHKLNVGAILEGSVRRAGNTVRITVQLIDAASGYHLWSQTYDRQFTDILKIQTDVAATVAQHLKVALIGDETAKFELGGTRNPEAYEAYLRGNQIHNEINGGSGGLRRDALAAFDRAIALDPDYAKAYVARAWALHVIAFMEAEPGDRATLREKARVAAVRSVALAPDLGQAHAALAAIRAYAFYDYIGAAPEFDRALALAPGSTEVQTAYAWYAADLGHLDAAENAARRAVSLNPQAVYSHELLGTILYYARQYQDALSVFKDAKLLAPNSHDIPASVLQTLLAQGEIAQARLGCESPATPINDDDRHYCLALAYHALGRQSAAESELKKFQTLDGDKAAGLYAGVYAQWGNAAAALRWLSKAEQLRDPILWTLKVDWHLDPIRNKPEFQAILARMNFPP